MRQVLLVPVQWPEQLELLAGEREERLLPAGQHQIQNGLIVRIADDWQLRRHRLLIFACKKRIVK